MRNMKTMKLMMAIAGAAMAAGLAGCGTVETPETPTRSWVPPASLNREDPVWQQVRLQTPKPEPGKPLTLAQLVDMALQNSPASRKAWEEARAASIGVAQAKAIFAPRVTAVGGLSYDRYEAEGIHNDRNRAAIGPGLELNYLVLNFGGGYDAAVEQAMQTVYAANFQFNQTISNTILATELAYYELASATVAIDAAVENLKDAVAVLDAATKRKDAGMATKLDVLQAQTISDQAKFMLEAAKGREKTARGALAWAVGIAADTPFDVVIPEDDATAGINRSEITKLIDDSLARRSDISALRAQVAAKEAAVKVAKAAGYPSLYLNGGAYWNEYGYYDGGVRGADRDLDFNAGISVRWDIFDGSRNRNEQHAASALARAAREELRQAELAAGAEVWIAYNALDTALAQLESSHSVLVTATEARRMAGESYQAGMKGILDLINAETQLANARIQEITARRAVFSTLARLAHAAGSLAKAAPRKAE